MRDVAATGEKSGDGNVLVDLVPVQADMADFDLAALRGCRFQKPGKPCERDAERSAVGEFDPHGVFVEANASCRNAHAIPSQSGRDCQRQSAG